MDLPDQGHGLGDTLTLDATTRLLTAIADQGQARGEDMEWLL